MLAHVCEFRRYVTNPIAQASSPPTPSASSGQALAKKRKDGAASVQVLHIEMVKAGPPAKGVFLRERGQATPPESKEGGLPVMGEFWKRGPDMRIAYTWFVKVMSVILVSTVISRKSTSGFRSLESAFGQTYIGRFRRDYINPLINRSIW